MNAKDAWQATLGQLQLQMDRPSFETWLRGAEFFGYEDGMFTISVRTGYIKAWLEKHLLDTIESTLSDIFGQKSRVRFILWNPPPKGAAKIDEDVLLGGNGGEGVPAIPKSEHSSGLNRQYTFDNFIVGPSNHLAHAAAEAVATNPGQRNYNPLFIYGGVGLGKTHLLHAIGNACARRGLDVLAVTSEDFTNDLVNAIRTRTQDKLREKYRNADVLLLDDVQFFAKKESSQEEFFHTFNVLHSRERQIVLTSDRQPVVMALEERLRSRFTWGLLVDIKPPELETRMAILAAKAEERGVTLPYEVQELIARRFEGNIRELEGALNRLLAYTTLAGRPMSVELAQMVLAEMAPSHRQPTIDEVTATVAMYYGLAPEVLRGPGRSHAVARARQVAMYLARREAKASLNKIGEALGGRDHSTVLYGCDKIAALLETDDALRKELLEIRERLYHPSRERV